ncbi:MAG TPA: CHAD domain-containing protein [Polyangiaceae bacterium]|nr:CHAD domain-containing protein [Polyangiaceae bacterium]
MRDLTQTDDARVHGTRKHLKRLRALAPLLDALEGERLSDADRFALRNVARSLGRARTPAAEAEAWLEVWPSAESGTTTAVGRMLQARRAPAAVVQRRLQRSERVLAGLGERVITRSSTLSAAEDYDHERLLKNLRRAYRKGRRTMQKARAAPSWERLHALRRASKSHGYQLQFLELFFEQRIKPERSRLARLADTLGGHHDLGGIKRYLEEQPAFVQNPGGRETLKKVRRRLRTLRRRCLKVASKSFRERPRAFEDRIRGYFESSAFERD